MSAFRNIQSLSHPRQRNWSLFQGFASILPFGHEQLEIFVHIPDSQWLQPPWHSIRTGRFSAAAFQPCLARGNDSGKSFSRFQWIDETVRQFAFPPGKTRVANSGSAFQVPVVVSSSTNARQRQWPFAVRRLAVAEPGQRGSPDHVVHDAAASDTGQRRCSGSLPHGCVLVRVIVIGTKSEPR